MVFCGVFLYQSLTSWGCFSSVHRDSWGFVQRVCFTFESWTLWSTEDFMVDLVPARCPGHVAVKQAQIITPPPPCCLLVWDVCINMLQKHGLQVVWIWYYNPATMMNCSNWLFHPNLLTRTWMLQTCKIPKTSAFTEELTLAHNQLIKCLQLSLYKFTGNYLNCICFYLYIFSLQ